MQQFHSKQSNEIYAPKVNLLFKKNIRKRFAGIWGTKQGQKVKDKIVKEYTLVDTPHNTLLQAHLHRVDRSLI